MDAFNAMSKKINEKFLELYLELDRACCEKFGVATGGVTEYINRLSSTRFAPNRDEVLPFLVKYRNTRNVFAHEPSAIRKSNDLTKNDVNWIKRFNKDLSRKKDPLSSYLKKARRYARNRKIKRFLVGAAIAIIIAVGVIAYLQLK